MLWPQARFHTQWPGTGRRGDPVFDTFYAGQIPFVPDMETVEQAVRAIGGALLDEIGAVVLVTHSRSGPLGWILADLRSNHAKAIVAVEPQGPPIENYFTGLMERLWGLTDTELTYVPRPNSRHELRFFQENQSERTGLARCWLQEEPHRKLVNLRGIPTLLVTAEASYHAPYDHCTANYLRQAGVPVDFQRLEAVGVRGNGHMMMLEKNNLEIAAFILEWLSKQAI